MAGWLEADLQAKQVARLSKHDAAYLAGLMDGEGTIALSRRHARENRQLVVTISSTERVLVDWVLQTTRAGKITYKKPTAPHHAPGLTYVIANRQARIEFERQFAATSIRKVAPGKHADDEPIA